MQMYYNKNILFINNLGKIHDYHKIYLSYNKNNKFSLYNNFILIYMYVGFYKYKAVLEEDFGWFIAPLRNYSIFYKLN